MAPYYGFNTWQTWCDTSATSNVVWNIWTDNQTTATAFTSTGDIWGYWASATISSSCSYTVPPIPPMTEEEQALAAERRRVAAIENEARLAAAAAAREKARLLLVDCLEENQREEFERDGYFHVETRDGTRRYRLRPGGQPQRVMGEDGRRWSYCIHPSGGFPSEDVVLAQKLLLETNEEEFLRIANASAAY